jgi:hypothetical protein
VPRDLTCIEHRCWPACQILRTETRLIDWVHFLGVDDLLEILGQAANSCDMSSPISNYAGYTLSYSLPETTVALKAAGGAHGRSIGLSAAFSVPPVTR